MKSGAMQDITDEILDFANGARSFPTAKVEYYDESTATWYPLKGVESLSVSNAAENYQYGKALFTPGANTASVSLDNAKGEYSNGSGKEFDGVLKRNLKIRASVGYVVSTPQYSTKSYTGTGAIKYKSIYSGGVYKSDATGTDLYTELPGISENWTFYGSLYGSGVYNIADGYYLSTIMEFDQQDVLNQLRMTGDGTTVKVYARSSDIIEQLEDNILPFELLGTTASGSNTSSLGDIPHKYFQFCLVFTSGVYGSGSVANIEVYYNDQTADFDQGEFLVDAPSWSSSYGAYKAGISARDIFKKAFETSITMPTYEATPVDVAQILRDALDRAKVPHNDGTELIPDTGIMVTITDGVNWKNESCISVVNEVMFYLYSKNNAYKLIRQGDSNLALVTVNSAINTSDWVLDYRYNLQSLSISELSDKLLQRATFLSVEHTTETEVTLDNDSFTTTGTKTLTWSVDSMYLRIETTGTATVSNVSVDLASHSLSFDIDSITGTYAVTLYGCNLGEGFSGYFGESISWENADAADGFTQKIVNRLIQSDAEAATMAEAYVSKYGTPATQATATINCNPLLEIGDRLLIWDKYTYTNSIYRIDQISISFSASGANLKQSLTLSDLGISIDPASFLWDSGTQYDTGRLWDQDLGTSLVEDTTNYRLQERF